MRLITVAALLLVGAGLWFIHGVAKIGAGYSAKQLCSGVFVGDMPADFVIDVDIMPRLSSTVPFMASLLSLQVEESSASARVLTASATASYRPRYGCTLHGEVADLNGSSMTSESRQASTVIDNPRFDSAFDTLFEEPEDGGRNTLAVVVMHRGEVIAERYAEPVTADTRLQGWSMNKSLMASLVGIQVERGLMSLDDPVALTLRESGVDPAMISGVSEAMTLRHLMTMSSGLDFDERYLPGDDVTEMLYVGAPMWQVPLKQGQRVSPGQEFVYSSGDTNVVSYLWQLSLAGEPYVDWVDREVNEPLGLTDPLLEPDVSGIQVGSSFAYLTARDWARYGNWWLDAYHGRDSRLSKEWQRLAVTPSKAAGGGIYGLSFWLNVNRGEFPSLPESNFHAGGNSGQFVMVMPESELVVVRLGLTLEEGKSDINDGFAEILAVVDSLDDSERAITEGDDSGAAAD